MRFYKEMIENVRRWGGVLGFMPAEMAAEYENEEKPKTRRFYELAEQAEVFVFGIDKQVRLEPTPAEPDLDLPFKVCSFENVDPMLLEGDDGGKMWVISILVHEQEPKLYEVAALVKVESEPARVMYYGPGYVQAGLMRLLKHYLQLLGSPAYRIGTETTIERVKFGDGARKRNHTLRRVIRVVHNREVPLLVARRGRAISFSHRFSVRGTWVRFFKDGDRQEIDYSRIGKDRDGNYCVRGFTWRAEHVKGPEDKPLVKKVRLVQESKKATE
jgi:hypothetical protein